MESKKIFPDWLLGVSFAATWTWAAAILVGTSILQEAGIIPFVLWFAANTAAIPFFGWASRRWPKLWDQTRRTPMRVLMSVMLVFTIWFNMTGIQTSGRGLTWLSAWPDWGFVALPMVVMLLVWLATLYGGIRWSVVSDRVQWTLELGSVLFMAVLVVVENGGFAIREGLKWGSYTDFRGWVLGLWTVPLLLSNPFLDGTFWHRAAYAKTMKPYWWGYGMFMIYLVCVAIIGFVGLTPLATIILFTVVFFASFSTLDACTAGLQLTSGWKFGNVLGLLAIPGWLLVAPMGLLDVWSLMFSWYPFLFAIQIITLVAQNKGWLKAPQAETLAARDALPMIDDAGAVYSP